MITCLTRQKSNGLLGLHFHMQNSYFFACWFLQEPPHKKSTSCFLWDLVKSLYTVSYFTKIPKPDRCSMIFIYIIFCHYIFFRSRQKVLLLRFCSQPHFGLDIFFPSSWKHHLKTACHIYVFISDKLSLSDIKITSKIWKIDYDKKQLIQKKSVRGGSTQNNAQKLWTKW